MVDPCNFFCSRFVGEPVINGEHGLTPCGKEQVDITLDGKTPTLVGFGPFDPPPDGASIMP